MKNVKIVEQRRSYSGKVASCASRVVPVSADRVPPVNLWSYHLFLNYVLTKGSTSLYSLAHK